ncbi:unnamed protein product [Allacma fusca]|uniref:Uncharacterized protein n=1 Tax=Allacma fusca TaxID=39272 RepID=A0A8J2NT73_9HEXA|nr:unnamed protein product [Allacma fusca]
MGDPILDTDNPPLIYELKALFFAHGDNLTSILILSTTFQSLNNHSALIRAYGSGEVSERFWDILLLMF